jgi:fermentation-respiration switch protein FrsA (DUF1100 family)
LTIRLLGFFMALISKKASQFVRLSLTAIVFAVFFWSLFTMIFEKQFVYFPDKYPSGLYNEASLIKSITDCWIMTEDSVKIHAWFAKSDSPVATLVVAHGNAGNISHRLGIIRLLQKNGFNVLMFDYRGYGRSEGLPDEEGIYRDGRAAFDYALNLPNVDPKRIFLWGTSLGGAVAVDVALNKKAAGLILESTFTSAVDVASVHYPFLFSRYLLRTKMNSADKISKIKMPLLMMHGNKDKIVPFFLGKKLYAAANEPKEFYEIQGADHNDTYFIGGDDYFKRVRKFVEVVVSAKK